MLVRRRRRELGPDRQVMEADGEALRPGSGARGAGRRGPRGRRVHQSLANPSFNLQHLINMKRGGRPTRAEACGPLLH